jgi:hypothetical protein
MKDINIKFIPQSEQRFNDVQQIGDYWETNTSVEIRVTWFDNSIYSMAIVLHELVEKFRNDQLGIKDADVDAFDLGLGTLFGEPGLRKEAPYHTTHMEADAIERLFIIFAGGDWVDYENAVDELFQE